MSLRSFVVLLLGAITLATFAQELSTPLQTLIQAERDFAKDSVARGTREAFIAAFAADGIGFQPQPFQVKEEFQKRPAPPGPRRGVLNWSPLVAEISQAGDLGYTTGPFVQENLQTKEKSHGLYSSVWKKQADGKWKVALDIGVSVPNAVAPLDAAVITLPASKNAPKYEAAWQALQQAAQTFLQLADKQGLAAAYQRYAADRMRLHRPDVMPFTKRADILSWAGKQTAKFTTIKIEAARSGDFGYSYGSYEIQLAGAVEKGYYAHYWRYLGRWQLVLEVLNSLPKQ
jgi:ketosteroid isomerase-like protein